MKYPFEIKEEVERINAEYSRTDQIIPLLMTNNNKKEEMVGHKLVGVRMTVQQQVIKLEHKVYHNGKDWLSLDNDKRARR